jgi:hypothetical protein
VALVSGVTVPIVEIVDMILVGDCLVAAAVAVLVIVMVVSDVGERVLVVVVLVGMVGVAVVDVVDVALVLQVRMTAIGSMPVSVIVVNGVQVGRRHGCSLLW